MDEIERQEISRDSGWILVVMLLAKIKNPQCGAGDQHIFDKCITGGKNGLG